jgi:hypothetical protein
MLHDIDTTNFLRDGYKTSESFLKAWVFCVLKSFYFLIGFEIPA